MDEITLRCNRALREQNDWLEDVLAGLLTAGLTMDEIEVRTFQHDPLCVVVAVRGEAKYEHRITFEVR